MEIKLNVSVIIPTYNRMHYIARAISSVLNQSCPVLEVIVVDDGSTDDTEAVVRQIAVTSPVPLRYIKKPNGGCATARNAGVKQASGEFIVFLDSDDELMPDGVESLLRKMAGSGADFVYSPSIEIGNDGKAAIAISLPAAAGRPDQFAQKHFFTLRARSCCILYGKYIFDKFVFNEAARYNEDSDFLQRVAVNFKAAYSPKPSAKVYQHAGSKSSNQKEIRRAVVRSYENIIRDYPDFAAALGRSAVKRIDDVKTDLVEVLVQDGEWTEAREVAGTMARNNLIVKLALLFNSAFPFAARRPYRFLKYIVNETAAVIAYRWKTSRSAG